MTGKPKRRRVRLATIPRPDTREVAVAQVTDKYSSYLLQLCIQKQLLILRQLRTLIRQPGCLMDCVLIANQGPKGLELSRPFQHGHAVAGGGYMVRQIDNIVIFTHCDALQWCCCGPWP